MSLLFDIPAQLAMLLSLAASGAVHEPAGTAMRAPLASPAVVAAEPLGGPMRFGERAWLQALYENAAQSGGYASSVFVTSSGRFYVPTADDRRKILDARNDAPLASRVARAAAERNAACLRGALRRAPSAADLFVAHVLGAASAIAFLKAVDDTPDMPLRAGFPALAASLQDSSADAARPIAVGQFYRQLSGVLRAPPRLVAIGLKPISDAPRDDAAWQAKVEVAKAELAP